MDDIDWLVKAVRQQNATLRKIVDAMNPLGLPLLAQTCTELRDDLDRINALLDHINQRVERG